VKKEVALVKAVDHSCGYFLVGRIRPDSGFLYIKLKVDHFIFLCATLQFFIIPFLIFSVFSSCHFLVTWRYFRWDSS